jgi:hypothetical protein
MQNCRTGSRSAARGAKLEHMAEAPKPDETQREAEAALRDVGQSQTFAQSALAKAAHRTGEHFAGRDPNDPPDDAVELWGRRIGRALSLAGVIGLAIYLYLTYMR